MSNTIYSINGPVIKVKNARDFHVLEKVYVGSKRLMGEVISMSKAETIIQVYESSNGLKVGEEVYPTGNAISVTLGPGLIGNIFDGIQRPLKKLEEASGAFIATGSNVSPLDEQRLWDVKILVNEGMQADDGMIVASVAESKVIDHKIMIPIGIHGTIVNVKTSGQYRLNDVIMQVQDEHQTHDITLVQTWPIKTARTVKKRLPISIPLVSGQRIFDTLFPIAKGGCAALPGGFGTGKTMTQHQLAKYCDADIIVYIGCGERGNEMTQVLEEFSELIDPRTNAPLLDRTILIANTSNMPVAAREASIYTGLTLAEYYRDMGYHVAIMADSTSRWAEALREISGRLEEMPAEEGFPAYLPSRISQFYERAGYVQTLNDHEGSVSIIGAVSPQGNDFSEPVTQNTKRFVRCFWALDKSLAYARHYFAVNWNDSYSDYMNDLTPWYQKNVGIKFLEHRKTLMSLLNEENQLMEIVKLIGSDVLPEHQKLVMEITRVIRVGFLQQNAFHQEDRYVSLEKQFKMMDVILYLYEKAKLIVQEGIPVRMISELGLFEKVIKIKYDIKNDELSLFDDYYELIDQKLASLL